MFKPISTITGIIAASSLVMPLNAYQADNQIPSDLLSNPKKLSSQLQSSRQISYQENHISISTYELRQPLYLSVKSKKTTKLSGWIYLNGKTLQKLEGEFVKDLSPYLKPGRNEVKISGFFRPVRGLVTIELKGLSSRLSSSTGGDGVLEQKIMINVN